MVGAGTARSAGRRAAVVGAPARANRRLRRGGSSGGARARDATSAAASADTYTVPDAAYAVPSGASAAAGDEFHCCGHVALLARARGEGGVRLQLFERAVLGSYARPWDGITPQPPRVAWAVDGSEELLTDLVVGTRRYTERLLCGDVREGEWCRHGAVSCKFDVVDVDALADSAAISDERHAAHAIGWIEDAPQARAAATREPARGTLVHTLAIEGVKTPSMVPVRLSQGAMADVVNALFALLRTEGTLPGARAQLAERPIALPPPSLLRRLGAAPATRMAASMAAAAGAGVIFCAAAFCVLRLRGTLPSASPAAPAALAAEPVATPAAEPVATPAAEPVVTPDTL